MHIVNEIKVTELQEKQIDLYKLLKEPERENETPKTKPRHSNHEQYYSGEEIITKAKSALCGDSDFSCLRYLYSSTVNQFSLAYSLDGYVKETTMTQLRGNKCTWPYTSIIGFSTPALTIRPKLDSILRRPEKRFPKEHH